MSLESLHSVIYIYVDPSGLINVIAIFPFPTVKFDLGFIYGVALYKCAVTLKHFRKEGQGQKPIVNSLTWVYFLTSWSSLTQTSFVSRDNHWTIFKD